jgi:hypothetical protein
MHDKGLNNICVEEPITSVLYLSYFYYIILYFCASLKSMPVGMVFPCRSFFFYTSAQVKKKMQ